MFEITMYELSVFVALGFCCGIFASVFLARLLEVVHLWRLVRETLIHLVWMLTKMIEDIEFLKEMRYKQMRESGMTPEQMRKFQEVDDQFLTNWKDSVIVSIVSRAPRNFRTMMPFSNWREAVSFLRDALPGERTR